MHCISVCFPLQLCVASLVCLCLHYQVSLQKIFDYNWPTTIAPIAQATQEEFPQQPVICSFARSITTSCSSEALLVMVCKLQRHHHTDAKSFDKQHMRICTIWLMHQTYLGAKYDADKKLGTGQLLACMQSCRMSLEHVKIVFDMRVGRKSTSQCSSVRSHKRFAARFSHRKTASSQWQHGTFH